MKIKLTRTGDSPLVFQGELLAEASSKTHQGPAEKRWFELAVYQAADGRYMCRRGFQTCWQGEQDHEEVEVVADAPAARRWFVDFDPCTPSLWMGVPSGVHDAERRNEFYRLAIGGAYRAAVTQLLDAEEFAETL